MSETEQHFHTISLDTFDALSYGQTAPEFHESLQGLILSSRKVLFNRFLIRSKEYADAPDGLSSVDEALSVLVQMERNNATAANELLLAPATGGWLAHVVGRLENTVQSDTPLWADIGFFNTIVAGFAHKHNVDFALTTPVINGTVHIPQQGTAVFSEHITAETVRIAGGGDNLSMMIDGYVYDAVDPMVETVFWKPVRRIVTRSQTPERHADIYGDMRLGILLDDEDPYNAGLGPHKPTQHEVMQWEAILDEAWEILVRASPNIASQLSAGLSVIVPYPQNKPFEAYSSSGSTSIGSIRASLPANALEAAEMLVHEYCGHSSLNKLLIASPLTSRDSLGNTLYAPWRDDPRPSAGLLHGIYAFSRVIDFYDAVYGTLDPEDPRSSLVDFERSLWRAEVDDCAHELIKLWYGDTERQVQDQIIGSPKLFMEGEASRHSAAYLTQPVADDPIRRLLLNASRKFVPANVAHDTDAASSDLSVTPNLMSLVGLAKADHRALWNAYHLKVDPDAIDMLSDSWLKGYKLVSSRGIRSRVEADPAACKLHARAIAMRHFLSDQVKFRENLAQQTDPMDRADRALILGKSVMAKTLYTDILRRNPLNREAFVGAGLSDRQDNRSANKFCTYWLRKPHVLLSLQAAIINKSGQPADYDTLNSWILGR